MDNREACIKHVERKMLIKDMYKALFGSKYKKHGGIVERHLALSYQYYLLEQWRIAKTGELNMDWSIDYNIKSFIINKLASGGDYIYQEYLKERERLL